MNRPRHQSAALFTLLALISICFPPIPSAAEIRDMAYLVDPSAGLTPLEAQEAFAAGRFHSVNGDGVHLGFTETDHWFRIVVPAASEGARGVLELTNPRLGLVTLYIPQPGGQFHERSLGVRAPFWNREVPGLTPAFPLDLHPDEPQACYIRVRNSGSLRFSVRIWSVADHNRHSNQAVALALAIGVSLLVMAVYNACIFLHLRQTGYLWIAVFLCACALRQLTVSAGANMFLWPDSPHWARHAVTIVSMGTLIVGVGVANNLLRIAEFAPWWARFHSILAGFAFAVGALSLTGLAVPLDLILACGIVIPLSVTVCAIVAIRRGDRSARWFLLSWGAVLLGAVVTTLVGPGLLPANAFTDNLLDFALIGAGLSWSFTLTSQIKVRQEEQQRILESQVKDRTAALEAALDAVRTLRGLLPICSGCKRIRDDQGYWQHVETYLHEHTEADFSHGLCPDCARRMYPRYFPAGADTDPNDHTGPGPDRTV